LALVVRDRQANRPTSAAYYDTNPWHLPPAAPDEGNPWGRSPSPKQWHSCLFPSIRATGLIDPRKPGRRHTSITPNPKWPQSIHPHFPSKRSYAITRQNRLTPGVEAPRPDKRKSPAARGFPRVRRAYWALFSELMTNWTKANEITATTIPTIA
jgi:hypothetical protein